MISIGIGEYVITNAVEEVVVTHALGSCVAVVLHCPKSKYTAMAHVVLPKRESDYSVSIKKEAYYAGDILPKLIQFFVDRPNCDRSRLRVTMVGGAEAKGNDMFHIGKRNVKEVRKILDHYHLDYDDTEVLGRFSRSVQIEVESGEVLIKKQPMVL